MYANLGPPVAYNHRSLKTCDWSSVSLERAVVTVCHDFQVSHIELPHALGGLFHHMVCIRGFHSWISLTTAKSSKTFNLLQL